MDFLTIDRKDHAELGVGQQDPHETLDRFARLLIVVRFRVGEDPAVFTTGKKSWLPAGMGRYALPGLSQPTRPGTTSRPAWWSRVSRCIVPRCRWGRHRTEGNCPREFDNAHCHQAAANPPDALDADCALLGLGEWLSARPGPVPERRRAHINTTRFIRSLLSLRRAFGPRPLPTGTRIGGARYLGVSWKG